MEATFAGNERPFHVVTPVLESIALSQVAGSKVYMKMENVQPTGSFKIRGIGYFIKELTKQGCHHFVCSSGGNAGLAAAYAARKLGVPATIVVPESSPPSTVKMLNKLGAEVEIFGKVWDDANERSLALAKKDGWVSVHPFDHPSVWKGHSSLVKELKDSLDSKPGVIVLSVGGGGLLAGVVAGLQEVGWQDVPIVAVETRGADSFNAAIQAGRLVTLPDITSPETPFIQSNLAVVESAIKFQPIYRNPIGITSVAKCLGAKTVAQRALDCASEHPIISYVLEDSEAVKAMEQFLDDERMLVEPACGASLALLYSGHIQRLQDEGRLSRTLDSVVVIVCGGSSIRMDMVQDMKKLLGIE